VLDLKMAPPTGWDILNALRCEDELRRFRVVVLSAVPGDLIPRGTRHVAKPFSIPELLDAVRTEIEHM
jgi:CheY-like chemotaxis protein